MLAARSPSTWTLIHPAPEAVQKYVVQPLERNFFCLCYLTDRENSQEEEMSRKIRNQKNAVPQPLQAAAQQDFLG